MSIVCNRCGGKGFLNAEQFPDGVLESGSEKALDWLGEYHRNRNDSSCSCHVIPPCNFCITENDIELCNCCGNGEDQWHGVPGEHYGPDDPSGDGGPYASNGGLCRCH